MTARARRESPSGPREGLHAISTGTAEIVPDRDDPGGWTLFVNGVPSSYFDAADAAHVSFEYLETMATLLDSARPLPDRVDAVHVGGAACSLPRRLAAARPRSRQVVFEIDADLVELARAEFGLAKVPGLKLRAADGAAGVAGTPTGSLDLLVRDAFAGAVTPGHLTTSAFLGDVARALRPDGLYLANIADRPPLTLARREVATAAAAFAHVALISEAAAFRGRRYANLVLAASARPLPIEVWNREIRGGVVPMRLLAGREVAMFTAGARPIEPAIEPPTEPPTEPMTAEPPTADSSTGWPPAPSA